MSVSVCVWVCVIVCVCVSVSRVRIVLSFYHICAACFRETTLEEVPTTTNTQLTKTICTRWQTARATEDEEHGEHEEQGSADGPQEEDEEHEEQEEQGSADGPEEDEEQEEHEEHEEHGSADGTEEDEEQEEHEELEEHEEHGEQEEQGSADGPEDHDTPQIYVVHVSYTDTDISRSKQFLELDLEPGLWQSQRELLAKPSEDGVLISWQSWM